MGFVYSVAARAGGNLPSDLPQAPALGSTIQGNQGSTLNKRKREAGADEQAPHQSTGDVHMSDELRSADDEEGSTSQQAPAKRKRCMGRGDPHDQTHDAAVGAMHAARAEPAGSAAQISQPAAAGKRKAAARKQVGGPVRRSKRLQKQQEGMNNTGVAL
ncbi:hypothetical protein ABBQ32_005535 [Trebouxia sp. C0010 RCD-2024]